jgi:hypothetical protein
MSAGEGWQNHEQQNHFFGVCRAGREYGRVNLRLDPFFSRAAAFEVSMAVSAVQAGGEVLADLKA